MKIEHNQTANPTKNSIIITTTNIYNHPQYKKNKVYQASPKITIKTRKISNMRVILQVIVIIFTDSIWRMFLCVIWKVGPKVIKLRLKFCSILYLLCWNLMSKKGKLFLRRRKLGLGSIDLFILYLRLIKVYFKL